ncbi:MAG TPA: hypothetical protein VFR97_05335 [Capillimicrobium sp.]|nr:hypothetical protein [Capillimicrobium sp.]
MNALAFILASAEGAEEHSKTAFYVAGGVLAAWAVLVSLVGISRPSFPGSKAAARTMMLLTALLVAGVMSTAVITA